MEAKRLAYHELPGFDGYVFEEGWVFGIYQSDAQFVIVIDAVLSETHANFGPPEPGQMYRYERIAVRFPNVRQLDWIQPLALHGIQDPDGTIDYGNIEFFDRTGDVSHLGGEWGEVQLVSDVPVVERAETEPPPPLPPR